MGISQHAGITHKIKCYSDKPNEDTNSLTYKLTDTKLTRIRYNRLWLQNGLWMSGKKIIAKIQGWYQPKVGKNFKWNFKAK